MAEIHAFSLHGYLSQDLAATDTTMHSPALAALPAISSPNFAYITFVHSGEIVKVTAHSASATSATIEREEFSTVAADAKRMAFWIHAPVDADFNPTDPTYRNVTVQGVLIAADDIFHSGDELGFFGHSVVTQPAAIADATDAPSAITQLNLALAALRTLGLIHA